MTRRYRRYPRYAGWNGRRRTRVQTKRLIRAWIIGAAVLAALLAALLLLRKPEGGRPELEEGDLLICVNGDGTADLSWPPASSPAAYHLELACGETRFERYYSRPWAQVSGVQAGEKLRVRVQAVTDGTDLFGKPRQTGSRKILKASLLVPEGLTAPEITGSVDKTGAVSLSWTGGEGDLYEIYAEDGAAPVASTKERSLTLQAGGENGLAVSGGLQGLRFSVRAGSRRGNVVLCGPASAPLSVSRRDLPSGPLSLTYEELSPRLYALEWNGTRCDRFEVRELRGENWVTVARLSPEERMRYDTGRLRSGSSHRFRVAALNRDGTEVESEEVSFYASISPLYSTIWPIRDLTLYENPGKGDRLATVPGGGALCVLAEEGDWFRVRYREEYGWVDSRFCMVNLPEYIGDYCDYDITNSYRSLFAAHDAPIRKITHQVIAGFEHVQTEDGAFLVPYLYPCAKKLLTAAQAARADGYQMKIYEAFRPQQATRFLYDTALEQLNQPALAMENGRAFNPRTGREVDLATGEETAASIAQPRSQAATLFRLMTDNGRFSLGSFLARTVSAHNRGIALDLTLEKLEDGQELEMQSAIHDLSWYAATDRNNLNAKLLAGYMTGVGMNGLSSEWWHFQDDATRSAIGLDTSLYGGVSPEGWTQDDTGWRYRNAGGSYVRNTTQTLDGVSYTFDKDGYSQRA